MEAIGKHRMEMDFERLEWESFYGNSIFKEFSEGEHVGSLFTGLLSVGKG